MKDELCMTLYRTENQQGSIFSQERRRHTLAKVIYELFKFLNQPQK